MGGPPEDPVTIDFGRFKVVRHRRELLADGRPVELGDRAFDTLIALIDARGAVLSKDELMGRVWPDRVVEENNLAAQISGLRKAFGADRHLIRTVAGRGYQFTGEIRVAAAPAAGPAASRLTNLPEAVSELIGREAELEEVTALATEHRLVSLVGAGGIGKTRLGLEVARHLLPRFPDGIFVAELGPLSSPELVPANVASALGLTHVAGTASPQSVAGAVRAKKLLLVIDNCEHVVEAAAGMAEALLRASPGVSLLATSREPLRISGEYVYLVPPLDVPAEDNQDTEDVFRHGAVRLFVSRAHAADPRYVAEGRVAAATAAICRHLDGIPLAIELAATRVAGFGVAGVAARLDDRFRLLTGGRRTLPRHQTMRATLDWSYELLSESERVVLRRFGVFVGAFTLGAASVVAASVDIPASEVADSVANLVGKSLLSADVGGTIAHYRLLETTRAYAREKLVESAEIDAVARRHADYCRDLFQHAEAELETRPTAEWLPAYRPYIDDLRAALDWAFSPRGDVGVGVALTAATVPLWTHLSLLAECRARVEQATASLGHQVPHDPRRDMRLYLALGHAILHTRAGGAVEMSAAFTKALELAEIVDDTRYRLGAIFGLYAHRLTTGEYRIALGLAEKFRTIAAETADRFDVPIGNRLIGLALHILGDQPGARQHLEPLVRSRFAAARPSLILYQYDQRVLLDCYYARVLWLQGCGDQAKGLTESLIDYVRTKDHALSLLYALLIAACPIALYAGDLTSVDHHVRLAYELAARHALDVWTVWAQCFEGVLLINRGEHGPGSQLLQSALERLPEPAFHHHLSLLLAELAAGLGGAGQIPEGLAVVDKALARAEQTEAGWYVAELLRVKGELLLLESVPASIVTAEQSFHQALDVARRQSALSLELRAAMSLARLWRGQQRVSQARQLLAPVYRRFTEGFGTADLIAAKDPARLTSLKLGATIPYVAGQPDDPVTIEFGRFTVVRHRRELLADGRPVELGGRAFDTLIALIDARGTVLSKDELMSRVWPDQVVEENNLAAQISGLRKVFGADRHFIRTVAGRGYQFTGEIRDDETAVTPAARPTNLPSYLPELIGRETSLGTVVDLITAHRFVTLTGEGGVGKTRLALEAARQLLPRFPDGAWLVELGPLADPALVPGAVAAALDVPLSAGPVTADRVAAALRAKHALIVLDNCEHVIQAAASMGEALVVGGALVRILSTSREPLRVIEEHIYHVPALDVPAEDNLDAEDVSRHGAVRLFDARAHTAGPGYVADPRRAGTVAAICRRLDGIPLAIELAAGCVPAFGVDGIAARLGDRFHMLTAGRRTALPHQQTLRATLDWSYELLSEPERITLRRLAIFAGSFSLEAAAAIVANPDLPVSQVPECVAGLVGRSLVSTLPGELTMQYRLLETTRAYALEKVTESGESQPVARRHAEYYRDLLERAEAEWEIRPTAEWLGAYARHTDNMRAALDWAFSSSGDAAVGVALTAAAVPLWFQQSLMLECRARVEGALASLEPGSARGDRREMQLFAALGVSLMQTKGPAPDTTTAWAKALQIAEHLNDIEYQLRALWGLWHFRVSRGECRAALIQAERFCDRVASTANPAEILVGRRMIGVSLHYLGDQTKARHHLEYVLAHYVAPAQRSHAIRFQYDQRVATRMMLARILWLQGFSDQALRIALDNVENARAIDHAMSLCYALEAACLVALWAGDRSAAERSVAMLLEHSARHALTVWHTRGRGLNGVLFIKHGDVGHGVRLLRASLDELSETGFVPHHTALLGTLAEGLSGIGQVSEGLTVVDEALARSERDEELWCIAELSRIKGEIVMQTGAPKAAATAGRLFRQSIDVARRQGALSLELRAAMSLARFWRGQQRVSQARKLLAPVYRRFTEGFGTADLVAAKSLLASLR